jgi:adenylate kinase family enzyme
LGLHPGARADRVRLVPAARADTAQRVRLRPLFERINVVGAPGSGKTTFGRQLAGLLDLPYYEMDRLFWKPGWQESPDDEFLRKVGELTSQPRWVLDGNYTRTLAIKWRHVQQVIWLDPSFVRTVFRVTARTIRRAFTREELWPQTGNRESLREAFLSRKSIIGWAIGTHGRYRKQYSALMASPEYAQISFVRLRSPGEARRFLERM